MFPHLFERISMCSYFAQPAISLHSASSWPTIIGDHNHILPHLSERISVLTLFYLASNINPIFPFHSEQLAYMPNTFFIGDHYRMFPHLSERIIMADPEKTAANGGLVADNVAVINAVNPEPIKEMANLTEIKYEGERLPDNKFWFLCYAFAYFYHYFAGTGMSHWLQNNSKFRIFILSVVPVRRTGNQYD
jgi:Glycosyl transferase family 41